MNAVVMCGGLGSRMLPLCEKTPKPMLRVVNRPVIDYLLKKLAKEGFGDIYLSLGYKAEEIVSYVEARDYGARIVFCPEEKPLGTAGGVKNALKNAPGDFLVISGDNIVDFDLDRLREAHYLSGRPVTIVGTQVEDPRDYGVIECGPDGVVTGFTEKPDWENVRSFFVNTGLYFCSGDVLDLIPDGEFFDFARDLFPRMLKEGRNPGCLRAEGEWYDIGGIDEYLRTNAALLREPDEADRAEGVWYGGDATDEDGNRFLAPCFVGKGVRLGGGAAVGPFSCIGDGTQIGRDCVITGSVVGEGCVIGSGTDLHSSVLSDGVRLHENVLLDSGAVIGFGADIGRFSRVFPDVKIGSGIRIPPESLVSSDVREQSGVSAELDLYGMNGRAYAGVTLFDAMKIGQARARAPCKKLGFACDGAPVAELYKSVCRSGAASCGAEAYDFGTAFRGQVGFYSHHCSLDGFVFFAFRDGEIALYFFGENGFPFPKRLRRRIADCYRYGSFSYAEPEKTGRRYRMELFSSVYRSKLKKYFAGFRRSVELTVESSNRCLMDTVEGVLQYDGRGDLPHRILFITDGSGSEAYFAEDDKVFYISAVQLFMCEYEFAQGGDVVLPEDAPEIIEKKAAAYGRKVFRAGTEANDAPDKALIFNCLWAFDSVFLAFRVCELIARTNVKLSEMLKDVEAVAVRKNVCAFDCEPARLRQGMEAAFGQRAADGAYYRVAEKGGAAKIRQLGNSSRVRILSEAAEMEAAKELSADIMNKIHEAIVDNGDKIE
ncbi:MAG: NTP transferase domain-containing protein [Clostridia bacterium]|nr:NTP transferase domain-containing protein [Clostridia bacterium]